MGTVTQLVKENVAGHEEPKKFSVLSYNERQVIWEWCRAFIDRECIYRTDEIHPVIPSKMKGGTYVWQCYLRRATFNAKFAHNLGLLFWDHFWPVFSTQPFQLCACAPSGPPIGSAIQHVARAIGIPINLFLARRSPKFGGDNWFEGQVLRLPVVMVDDVAASANHLKLAAARVQLKLNLPLHRNYFTLVNKVGRALSKDAQHTEHYLNNELVSLFTMNNFCLSAASFKECYGQPQNWTGPVK